MKIAIITPNWPCKSEVPILNQIIQLKKNGYNDLHFFAFDNNIEPNEAIPQDFFEHDLLANITYLKQPSLGVKSNKVKSKLLLIVKALPYLFRTFLYSLQVFFKALFKKEYGEYRAAFKIIYAVQNLLGKKYEFDIIHCHYAPYGIWGAILKDLGLLNGKLITTFHGYGINKRPKLKPAHYYDFLIKQSYLFTSNSNFTKSNAVLIGFPEDRIHIIRVSLQVNLYKFRARGFEKDKCFNILTVAALRNVKGIQYTIKAIKIIIETNPNIKILYQIIGEGYLKATLEKIIKENELDNYVKLVGFVTHTELKKCYYDAHVFVLSSTITKTGNQEAQGLVFQEAQACGLPVIGSNTGGIPEGMLDGQSGFIVPDKDPKTIAEKIMYFYNQPEKIAEFGRVGRSFVISNFNIEVETQKLLALHK